MLTAALGRQGAPLSILCLGAHCDDIEIGCGGTLLRLLGERPGSTVTWMALASSPEREREARGSAAEFLAGAAHSEILVESFRDGYFPAQFAQIKDHFEAAKARLRPDLILTHHRADRHQDHRTIAELTWNTFRNHVILEYEIPKYDGDLGTPNVFVPLDESICRRKVSAIAEMFVSQRERAWFEEDTFWSLLRLRGMECNSPSRYAEAFYCRKMVLGLAQREDGLGSTALSLAGESAS